jgi:hypothetical protein
MNSVANSSSWHYLDQASWDMVLSKYIVEKKVRTGAIFGQVVKYLLKVQEG